MTALETHASDVGSRNIQLFNLALSLVDRDLNLVLLRDILHNMNASFDKPLAPQELHELITAPILKLVKAKRTAAVSVAA